MIEKIYLGDSVYCAFDGFHIVLTTENGLGPSNTIYMEPGVIEALEFFIEKLKTKIRGKNEQGADS